MSPIDEMRPVRLQKGANIALADLDAGLGSITVVLSTTGAAGPPIDADVSVLLLGPDGNVRSNDDFVFYNQPVALAGAVHLRDRVRAEVAEGADEDMSSDVVTLELDDVPDDVEKIVLVASVDADAGWAFGDAGPIRMRLQRSADAAELLIFEINDATTETAMLLIEFYRRSGAWRLRAVGQGYDDGLSRVAEDFGVEVEPVVRRAQADQSATQPKDDTATGDNAIAAEVPPVVPRQSIGDEITTSSAVRRLSVRRPARAPKMPADWDETLPEDSEVDWQIARLFPIAGIGGGEEQERRATSAFLAVLSAVREFGRAVTRRFGAPAGTVETFIEVPFGHDDQAYRPDGVIRASRGQREWTALVEVKTSDGELRKDQVDAYVDIARAKGFDAVITISNELTDMDDDHPVAIDRRKLKKITLRHLSWDEIRTEAVLLLRNEDVADPTQRHILAEFLRYMEHARSGLHGFTDMGPDWVRVREAVKAKTLRSGDRATASVSRQFDQLMRHTALQLSCLLGVEVEPVAPRAAPDSASRCQQLADSGLMFGSLRVPGASDLIVLSADLRADRVGCSIDVAAPREGRPLTRVNWLLRQLADARDATRVEALLSGRNASTARLLGALRKAPESLVSSDGREIRAFRVSLEMPMGSKRSNGSGSLIHSVCTVTNVFYAEVVQHLRAWTPRPPRIAEASARPE